MITQDQMEEVLEIAKRMHRLRLDPKKLIQDERSHPKAKQINEEWAATLEAMRLPAERIEQIQKMINAKDKT